MCYLRASGPWHELSEEGALSLRSGGPGEPASCSCLCEQKKTEGGGAKRTEQNQLLPPGTTATKGYFYTTKGCCSQQDTLKGWENQSQSSEPPAACSRPSQTAPPTAPRRGRGSTGCLGQGQAPPSCVSLHTMAQENEDSFAGRFAFFFFAFTL